MGMYTEFHFNASLKENTPIEIIEVLQTMLGDEKVLLNTLKHPLFTTKDSRWRFMLQCDSYCFDADTHSTLRYDDIGKSYYLCIRCNLKNYENEIENFVDWIKPYLDKQKGDFLGFSRYEETEQPTLIFM